MIPGGASTCALLAGLMLSVGAVGAAAAQAQPAPVVLCRDALECLRQMVDDLREHRQYLEDQLSLAKSLLNQANQRVSQQLKEIEALKGAGAAPEKKP